ncbi:hypothetical protein VII00023_14533, partial [Vibrio ichthyoenteri ATCC 700023]
RDGTIFPDEGIKFSVVITIEDPSNSKQELYNELTQSLKSIGVQIEDITLRDHIKVQ